MKETIEDCAAIVWGLARDLSSPRSSGTPLNSERNIKHIASIIQAYAICHAETESVAREAYKVESLKEEIKALKKTIGELKLVAKATEKTTHGAA